MKTRFDALGYLRAHGITNAAAAAACGMSRQNFGDCFKGAPEVESLLAVANGLGFDVREFFVPLEGEGERRKTAMRLDVGEVLRERGISNTMAARECGMHRSDLTRILGGSRTRLRTLYALADGLDIDIREFFRPMRTEEQDAPETAAPKPKKVLNVQWAAEDRGVTMKTLAERVGVWPQELTRRLKVNPKLSLLQSVADALGCEVPELFYNESAEEREAAAEEVPAESAPEAEEPTIPSETIDKERLKVFVPFIKTERKKRSAPQNGTLPGF